MSASTTTTVTVTQGPEVRELSKGFGAEITGLNFREGVTEDSYQLIYNTITQV